MDDKKVTKMNGESSGKLTHWEELGLAKRDVVGLHVENTFRAIALQVLEAFPGVVRVRNQRVELGLVKLEALGGARCRNLPDDVAVLFVEQHAVKLVHVAIAAPFAYNGNGTPIR